MAGHSKWANIQHRKNAQDAKRGKVFTKFIREITVAARMGGEALDANPRLRLAVDKALDANMTKDTIERAIKKGVGSGDSDNMASARYEGYGPGGVAVMVDCLTDNRNRTVAEVRHAFTKHGGNLGTDGSVAYLFEKKGSIQFSSDSDEKVDENTIMELAIEAGADDVITDSDGSIEIVTSPEAFEEVKKVILNHNLKPTKSEITLIASTDCTVDFDTAERLLKMVDVLEDLDDVQEVYTNVDIPDAVMEKLNQ